MITVAWILVECSVALSASLRSHSVALLAFGSDSFIELLSALIVLAQFGSVARLNQRTANRFAAALLFVLTGFVAISSAVALLNHVRPETSVMGMAITIGALVLMPVLARSKRRKARELNNRAMAADATQSAICAYLAAVTLVSLAFNAMFHISWLDPVAALGALPLLIVEGRRTWRGESCGCC